LRRPLPRLLQLRQTRFESPQRHGSGNGHCLIPPPQAGDHVCRPVLQTIVLGQPAKHFGAGKLQGAVQGNWQIPAAHTREADILLRAKVPMPAGYAFSWSGQWEAMQHVREKLRVVLPLTLLLVFMLLYLDLSFEQAKKEGRLRNLAELREAIIHGAVKRIRPKPVTVSTTLIGLVPIIWAMGTGSDIMKRIAAPRIGGIVTSFLLELLV